MNNSGSMKTISEVMEIIEGNYTIIPLLQRNYKWTMECAAELAEDLWENFNKNSERKYQLNMITIYKDERNNRLQILDGQQRVITLKLLLAFLEPDKVNFNFLFERDFASDERNGRRHFIDKLLKDDLFFGETKKIHQFSVDAKRLYNNFIAMLIPFSFRDILEVYNDIIQEQLKNTHNPGYSNHNDILNSDKLSEELFIKQVKDNVIKNRLFMFSDEVKNIVPFSEDELNKLWNWCKKFNERFNNTKNQDEEDSNDEVRISKYSQEFMEIWIGKVENLITNKSLSYIREKISNRGNFVSYIKNQVEVLYHETTSEPIDEFLNINENKTRFVISDYIRANMISDNPIEICGQSNEKNVENRKSILDLFKELANYLYNDKYAYMWELVKIRYDDFEKNKDINRLKIVFCDKYSGTSTRGYKFETELKRLQYFQYILKGLSDELECDQENAQSSNEVNWNTYNAVYMLLECKKKYRFFNLFNLDDIENETSLKDVTARERFCFFEWAYIYTNNSEDPWDISYFLESQLYDEKCEIKKDSDLPKKKGNANEGIIENSEWCYVSRGKYDDELSIAIKNLIDEKKSI